MEVAIRVVFYDQGLVLHRHFQHLFPALGAQQDSAGVAKCGDEIDKLRLVLGNQLLQLVGLNAVGVDGRADDVCAIQAKALDGGEKCGAFNNHLVAGADHGFAQQVQRLLAAGRDDQALRCQIFHALAGHEDGDLFAQRVVALGSTVLQCCAGFLAERGVDGFADAFHVKHGAVGKTAGKADDAGLAQQLEKFADGGRFDVVEAVGKMQWRRL